MSTLIVRDVMTDDVASVRADTPFKSVVWALATRQVSGAPVLDADRVVVGVVTEADLLPKQTRERRVVRWPFSSRARRLRARKACGLVTGELMSAPAVTVTPDTPLSDAAVTLARYGVRRLPVVDAAGRLVGVLSRRDALRAFLRADSGIALEIERDVLKEAMCVDPASVWVQVRDGVVTLSGQLEHKGMVACAEELTRAVDGVVDLVNDLTYARDDTTARPGVAPSFWPRHESS